MISWNKLNNEISNSPAWITYLMKKRELQKDKENNTGTGGSSGSYNSGGGNGGGGENKKTSHVSTSR